MSRTSSHRLRGGALQFSRLRGVRGACVQVGAQHFDALSEPTEDEEDMLDEATCLTATSRLGCQIILSKELEGLEVTLPAYSRNYYVDGHVPEPH